MSKLLLKLHQWLQLQIGIEVFQLSINDGYQFGILCISNFFKVYFMSKIYLGIDIGSTTVKIVALDERCQLLAWHYLRAQGQGREKLY